MRMNTPSISCNVSHPRICVEVFSRRVLIFITSTLATAFVGLTQREPINKATKISSFSKFTTIFGD